MIPMTTRRSFLQTAALAAAGVTVSPQRAIRPKPVAAAALRVRRNFNLLDPNGPEVAALRAGVAAMQALNTGLPMNPKSWLYQRGIHRVPSPPPNPLPVAWNTCTHHGFPGPAFLSWHRGFLHYFERICRAASGDDTFTLPYWNYDLPGENVLPWSFLDSTAGNPLYHAPRDANDGNALDPFWLGEAGTISVPDFDTFQSALQTCHDNTHGVIGGDMGGIPTAALDPIFYLHHCNIDRCWRHWQIQRQGSADPSPLPSWWTTSWTFFDETGTAVPITGEQAEHTTNLGYVYDDEPILVAGLKYFDFKLKLVTLCQRFPFLCRPLEFRVQRPPWPLPLTGGRPLVLPGVRLAGPAVQALWTTKRETASALNRGLLVMTLVLEWREGAAPLIVEARPVGAGEGAGWIRAGAASSFARGGGARDTIQVDVSRLFDVLDQKTGGQGLEWRVRFTSGRLTADGRESPLAGRAAQARIWGAQLVIPGQDRR